MMTAHYHGQIWNAAELARSLDVNPNGRLIWISSREPMSSGSCVPGSKT